MNQITRAGDGRRSHGAIQPTPPALPPLGNGTRGPIYTLEASRAYQTRRLLHLMYDTTHGIHGEEALEMEQIMLTIAARTGRDLDHALAAYMGGVARTLIEIATTEEAHQDAIDDAVKQAQEEIQEEMQKQLDELQVDYGAGEAMLKAVADVTDRFEAQPECAGMLEAIREAIGY